MFSEAYKIATQYTFPILVSSRFYDGTVESGLGSFVIINSEGWVVTAAHILTGLQQHQNDYQAYIKYEQDKNASHTSSVPNPKWMINHSIWFGADHHQISQFHILKDNDLAIGKIENYNPEFVKKYPIFVNPKNICPGTSLCKLGYPFYDVQATFDAKMNSFRFDPSIFPIPTFPLDGIMTRNVLSGKSPDGKYDFKWIETSSPGLRGQSGGPTFDTLGRIWAIQSQTRHMPLGFSPKVIKDNIEIEENQFINVGIGVHVEVIMKFLTEYGVSFNVSQ